MSAHTISALGRTVPQQRRDATRRDPINPATLVAVMLFLAVLLAEVAFFALNAHSIADLGAVAALAASVP
jgi:hypothetical protein